MQKNTYRQYIYHLSLTVLQWSMVYTLVLFFLEDLRPFMVSSIFAPHWSLGVLVISLAGVLGMADYADRKSSEDEKKMTILGMWIYRSIFVAAGIFLYLAVDDMSWIRVVLMSGFVYIVYVLSKKLV